MPTIRVGQPTKQPSTTTTTTTAPPNSGTTTSSSSPAHAFRPNPNRTSTHLLSTNAHTNTTGTPNRTPLNYTGLDLKLTALVAMVDSLEARINAMVAAKSAELDRSAISPPQALLQQVAGNKNANTNNSTNRSTNITAPTSVPAILAYQAIRVAAATTAVHATHPVTGSKLATGDYPLTFDHGIAAGIAAADLPDAVTVASTTGTVDAATVRDRFQPIAISKLRSAVRATVIAALTGTGFRADLARKVLVQGFNAGLAAAGLQCVGPMTTPPIRTNVSGTSGENNGAATETTQEVPNIASPKRKRETTEDGDAAREDGAVVRDFMAGVLAAAADAGPSAAVESTPIVKVENRQ